MLISLARGNLNIPIKRYWKYLKQKNEIKSFPSCEPQGQKFSSFLFNAGVNFVFILTIAPAPAHAPAPGLGSAHD